MAKMKKSHKEMLKILRLKKQGKLRKNAKKVRLGMKVWKKRAKKVLSQATKTKISKSMKKAWRSGKTLLGKGKRSLKKVAKKVSKKIRRK